jgi:membrane associated rhomboid family serine protease
MSQMQFQAPPLTKTNKIILSVTLGVFILFSILKAIGAFSLVNFLGLSASGLLSGFVFQLVTYPFVETQLMTFIFNALIIWFIGSELEATMGSKVYSRFLLLTAVSVGLIFALIATFFFYGTYTFSAPLFGLTGINFALLIAYATLYPDRQLSLMMIFPMRARTFCFILAGIEAYMAIFNSLTTAWAHLLAMGISYLIIRYQSQPILRSIFQGSSRPKSAKKGHLYVVKDDDKTPPKYWQ